MEEQIYTPASVVFKRTDDPGKNLMVAFNSLVAATQYIKTKYIYVRPEMLNNLTSKYGIEGNSDGELFFAGVKVFVDENLQAPFEFISDANPGYPKKIMLHNDFKFD